MIPTPDASIFRPIAECAVLVEFGTAFDQAAHAAVLRQDQALAANPCAGFREAVPAFVNLLVEFDPLTTDHATVSAHLCRLLTTQTTTRPAATEREVLVCFDPALSPDIAAVAGALLHKSLGIPCVTPRC